MKRLRGGGRRDDLPNIADWDEHQRLNSEKEVLGFFVSGSSAG